MWLVQSDACINSEGSLNSWCAWPRLIQGPYVGESGVDGNMRVYVRFRDKGTGGESNGKETEK